MEPTLVYFILRFLLNILYWKFIDNCFILKIPLWTKVVYFILRIFNEYFILEISQWIFYIEDSLISILYWGILVEYFILKIPNGTNVSLFYIEDTSMNIF
jgi:hypothetical protein